MACKHSQCNKHSIKCTRSSFKLYFTVLGFTHWNGSPFKLFNTEYELKIMKYEWITWMLYMTYWSWKGCLTPREITPKFLCQTSRSVLEVAWKTVRADKTRFFRIKTSEIFNSCKTDKILKLIVWFMHQSETFLCTET